ncbi:hypothetical protein LARV_03815 [Longilinea arvoryzae]|uniref:Periplasmic component of the Tol biopolymer transport system n=1 Tax=Longilinea arvoryzae TaxID=360412 RepID=A0A0K8MXT7_9CHLR|nr:WD40 repeat domain-containing protein [Longilinea arvoryzae]GAP16020.1 hypothetical protein LARV_03815 [Longilinea arvoryzae]
MKRKFWLQAFLVPFLIILTGCSSTKENQETTAIITSPESTKNAIIGTPIALATKIKVPAGEEIPFCHGSGTHKLVTKDIQITGTIVFQTDDLRGLYTLGGSPLTSKQVIPDNLQSIMIGFSPDGNWFAYAPFDSGVTDGIDHFDLTLLSAEGKELNQSLDLVQLEEYLQEGYWFMGNRIPSFWISSDLIYVTLYARNPEETSTAYRLGDFPRILDPFTGSWENQLLDLPEYDLSSPVGISPDRSRALYAEMDGLSLWDYDRGETIRKYSFLIPSLEGLSLWSPDGSKAAYVNLNDDYSEMTGVIIKNDGSYLPLVNKEFPKAGLFIQYASWSPNSKLLALAVAEGEDINLLIYDAISEQYIHQCIVSKALGYDPALTWSPDSAQIAISSPDSPILLYDLPSGNIFELAQHGRVKGWSDKFPLNLP